MREQHAVNAELKSSGLLSAYGRMQTGRFGLLSIGRANVATRAGAEWPGLVVNGQAAFGTNVAIAAVNRNADIERRPRAEESPRLKWRGIPPIYL